LPNSTEVGFIEKDSPEANVTVALLAGGGSDGAVDGAVEKEEHAARQKPRRSRIMISFLSATETRISPDAEGGHSTPGTCSC
jgi:hypothetical protein